MIPAAPISPTLYAIVAMKMAKAAFLLLAAFVIFAIADQNIAETWDGAVRLVRLDPEQAIFTSFGERLAALTQQNIRWLALGALLYSVFSIAEGLGLFLRFGWAGWLAIGESALFIPLEIRELLRGFSVGVLLLLIVNSLIVWYLYRNRTRLFPAS